MSYEQIKNNDIEKNNILEYQIYSLLREYQKTYFISIIILLLILIIIVSQILVVIHLIRIS